MTSFHFLSFSLAFYNFSNLNIFLLVFVVFNFFCCFFKCFFNSLTRAILFLSSSPIMSRLWMIFLTVVIAPHGEVEQSLPVARLATNKLLVAVGLELLATTLAEKHMANVPPNLVLVRRWQRLKSLETHITGVNPLSLSFLCYVLLCFTSS